MWDLKHCRWFTRGWTLQELIAPPSVSFHTPDGRKLGDKKSLERILHKVTGIPLNALRGSPLSDFRIEERMSWSDGRETTCPEDKAYSLLGIFGIHMEIHYGEGEQRAFARLRELILRGLVDLLSTKPRSEPSDQVVGAVVPAGGRLQQLRPGNPKMNTGCANCK